MRTKQKLTHRVRVNLGVMARGIPHSSDLLNWAFTIRGSLVSYYRHTIFLGVVLSLSRKDTVTDRAVLHKMATDNENLVHLSKT